MLPGPNNILLKLSIFFAWFAYLAITVAMVLTHKVSSSGAIIFTAVLALSYFSWSTGLHLYLFSGELNGAKMLTKAKSFAFRFCSSWLYPAVFLPLLCTSLWHNQVALKPIYLLFLALFSFVWFILYYQRARLIEDTASTQLTSTAQGYARVEGVVRLYDGEVVRSPHKEMPIMAWYAKDMLSSSAGFILEDEKGRCTIDPFDAEVITPSYFHNDHTYKALYPGDTLYVFGALETLSKQRTEYERQHLITQKIVSWKQNRFQFLDYFDKNRDGKIDDSEMAFVRDTATRNIDDELEAIYEQPATHVISRPFDGRPFLMSSIDPHALLRRYKIASLVHGFIWLGLSILLLFR